MQEILVPKCKIILTKFIEFVLIASGVIKDQTVGLSKFSSLEAAVITLFIIYQFKTSNKL